jgi:hypothetical protein
MFVQLLCKSTGRAASIEKLVKGILGSVDTIVKDYKEA